MSTLLNAFVKTIRHEADDVISIELLPAPGSVFPAFDAGSHIDIHLPGGLVRNYSLLNSCADDGRYVIGVLKDRASRGGSRAVHEQLRVGMTIPIAAPRNNFRLHEDAGHSVLVAGGIGITPILCMVQRLKSLGRSQELLYFARSRRSAAFVDRIEALGVPVTWHFDDEQGGPPNLKQMLGERPAKADTHYYACGPSVLLDAFERECEALGYAHAHIERFAAVAVEASANAQKSYIAELHKSGRVFTITPEKSLLACLLEGGVDVEHSCLEGVCGTCETGVISGVPDHRDSVLSNQEKASNKVMMVCVSGCTSDRLVLDL
ncbi:PDR/VanB family oxidoreductase [soil metagenome]